MINNEGYAAIRLTLHDALLAQMDADRDPFVPAVGAPAMAAGRQQGWHGPERQRPDDGYLPSVLEYPTGLPPAGAVRKPA